MDEQEIIDVVPEASKELARLDEQSGNVMDSINSMPLAQLKKAAKLQSDRRKVIADFVKSELVQGVDYGTVKSEKNGKKFESKPALWKPGQEKIFSLFSLTSKLSKDTETLEMLGDKSGTVAYVCRVYRNGVFVAEGRGAADLGNMGRDSNSTIKIAEKRARMDACLALGFSEFFTQDIDDPDYKNNTSEAPGGGNTLGVPASQKQKQYMVDLMTQAGIRAQATALKLNGIDPNSISSSDARRAIDALKAGTFKTPTDAAEDGQEPPAAQPPLVESTSTAAEGDAPTPESVSKPVVDMQFKEDVYKKFEELQYDTRDQMRIFRNLTGTPVPPKTDEEWLKVDTYLNNVAAGDVAGEVS